MNQQILTTANQESKCKCLNSSADKQYCHPMFGMCLPILTPPKPMNNRRPSALPALSTCKDDRDCVENRYCHTTFKKCLNILPIPTLSTTKKSVPPCKNDSDCSEKQYCHEFFKMCLIKPVKVYQTSSTPHPRYNCTSDTHCQSRQYCHNMTHMCLDKYNLSGIGVPTLPPKHRTCKRNFDCMIGEFCSRSSGPSPIRQPSKCSNAMRCPKFRRRQIQRMGVCISNMIQFDQHLVNCSSDQECGSGMCCLVKLGICTMFVRRGHRCVAQVSRVINSINYSVREK